MIPSNSHVADPRCLPRFVNQGDHAVLVFHGFTGSPHDLGYLGDRLVEKGYSLVVPRLPGHGTNRQDFLQTGWKQWLRRATDVYLDTCARFPRVSVGGLSMGGLLALLVASRFPVHDLFLAAPALLVQDGSIRWTPLLQFFRKTLPKKREHAYEEPYLQKLNEEYWSQFIIPKIADLYHLQKMARRALPSVKARCFTILARKDPDVASAQVEQLLQAHFSSQLKTLWLEASGHVVVNDCEKEAAADGILQWLGG